MLHEPLQQYGENHMRDIDVIALGELLIDFIQNGETSQGNPLFEANPGGAPCNVLAMLAGYTVVPGGDVSEKI